MLGGAILSHVKKKNQTKGEIKEIKDGARLYLCWSFSERHEGH